MMCRLRLCRPDWAAFESSAHPLSQSCQINFNENFSSILACDNPTLALDAQTERQNQTPCSGSSNMTYLHANDSIEGALDHSAVAPELMLDTSGNDLIVRVRSGNGLTTDVYQLSGGVLSHVTDETRPPTYETGTLGGRDLALETDQLNALQSGPLGQAGSFYSDTTGFAGDRVLVLHTQMDGQSIYVAAVAGQAGLYSFTRGSDGSLQQIQSVQDTSTTYANDPGALASWVSMSATYVFVASQYEAGVTAYQLEDDGSLSAQDSFGAEEGFGVSRITQLATIEVAGHAYLVVAAAGTSSLSVLRLDADGTMTLVDHLIDSLDTRFAGITMLETVVVNDVTYLLVAGQDDGLSLFTVLPDGTLLHLDALADSYSTGLVNVNSILTVPNATGFDVFVTSELDAGLTHLTVDLGQGSGVTQGTTDDDTLTGGSGVDHMVGNAGNDTLYGGAGQDIILGGAGQDILYGGAGGDLFVLDADLGHDQISDFVLGEDRIDVSAWDGLATLPQLTITSVTGGALIEFGLWSLTILTQDGTSLSYDDFLQTDVFGIRRLPQVTPPKDDPDDPGTEDADTLIGTQDGDVLSSYGGNDVIYGDDGGDILYGGTGDDRLFGEDGADQIYGGDNTDYVYAGHGEDHVYGGEGSDTAYGGAGNDVLYGEGGHEYIYGNDGDDRISGGTGADRLYGNSGNDSITGDSSTDTLYGGDDDDHMAGGTGEDVVYGGAGNDSLFGNTGVDTVYGDAGDDFISPGNGVDTVYGGAGNDHIIARTGYDTVWGGSGDDSIFGSEGQDLLFGDGGNDYLSGGYGYDTVYGGGGEDLVYGNIGEDVLYGGGMNDYLYGATGNDAVYGGDGDDVLFSSQGRDTLDGGTGDDQLAGGSLNDLFQFGLNHGHDRIIDFELTWDTLQLDQGLWSGTLTATQVVAQFATVIDGDVVFDFGDGNSITIENYTSTAMFEGVISLV